MQKIFLTSEAKALLRQCNLPFKDLPGNKWINLFGALQEDELIGIIGIEVYGKTGLLRSLAVAEEQRGYGLGRGLVTHAEEWAAESGIQSLWLLTETASAFFEKLGYTSTPRSSAPESIRQSAQFKDLCPASAVLMTKTISS